MGPIRILLVEDNPDDYNLEIREIKKLWIDAQIERVMTKDDFWSALLNSQWDVIVSDYDLPGFSGSEVISIRNEARPEIPVIIISGTLGEARAVEIMKSGASDFILKDNIHRLAPTIQREYTEAVAKKNLTERLKAKEFELLQAAKMEAIGRLAGGVSHDYNNKLAAIMMNCTLALNELDKNSPASKFLSQIQLAAETSVALTRQLLAFSRKQVATPKILNLDEVIVDSEKILRPLLGENIVIVLKLSHPPHFVLADPVQIDQILMNLCLNARDAMPQGGEIRVECDTLTLVGAKGEPSALMKSEPYIRLRISDNGVGMSEETLKHIYEPFFTTKQFSNGTGLGLSTVHRIVHQLKGKISVKSSPGKGTQFEILIPAEVPAKWTLDTKVSKIGD